MHYNNRQNTREQALSVPWRSEESENMILIRAMQKVCSRKMERQGKQVNSMKDLLCVALQEQRIIFLSRLFNFQNGILKSAFRSSCFKCFYWKGYGSERCLFRKTNRNQNT